MGVHALGGASRWALPALVASALLWILAAPRPAAADPLLEVYTRPGCIHCASARDFLAALASERPGLVIVEHDITREPDALERLRTLSARAGVATAGVPTFVIGEHVVVGFDPDSTPSRLGALLDETRTPPSEGSIDLPLFGRVSATDLGLPLFTVAVGLVDGFNPCATWVLLFLLAMLVHLENRSRMALIAGTFVVVSGVVYFGFMAAWLTFFTAIGLSQPVRIVLGVLGLVVGALHLNDALGWMPGASLRIPTSAKPGLYRRVRAILNADNLAGAMVGIVALAFLVNVVELLCTAGLPALYTAILTRQELASAVYYAYLGLYAGAYMADDAVLVTLGVLTLSQRRLQEGGGRALQLLSGSILLVLGTLFLVSPGWMGF